MTVINNTADQHVALHEANVVSPDVCDMFLRLFVSSSSLTLPEPPSLSVRVYSVPQPNSQPGYSRLCLPLQYFPLTGYPSAKSLLGLNQ